ncbi:Non-canonical purine NTP pyrophosphatase [Pseudobythopirellula maris]|uniref:dITP/XTP pyrophosphatase n=1 Tax=Pseudobythopirellula maris TaxID=2527991 RepID=A0A5C5ZMA9_9BACT|nr:RdgB/HAM1 family non-canonical purine NTP pyrophosphatase [Pseudobythopirellula maris]TWT88290.1 Non-canonical purine NTP pyrophosphatase [Pseudobythopirellula maris]
MTSPTLVIGSHNAKKGRELAELVAPYGLTAKTLADFPDAPEPVEDGDTFEANARIKATEQARALGQWVIADDSGICVDALGGEPGIYSARFAAMADAGEGDEANNTLLLSKLDGLPPAKRGAHYVAVVALADPTGEVRAETRGECHGRITTERRGANGFGYDPLFELREYHRTFGELGPEVKRALSHRSRAMRQMLPRLVALLK